MSKLKPKGRPSAKSRTTSTLYFDIVICALICWAAEISNVMFVEDIKIVMMIHKTPSRFFGGPDDKKIIEKNKEN